MKIVRLSKNSNLNRIDKVFKWSRFSGRGPSGQGLPAGGLINQMIRKTSSAVDFATEWFTIVAATVGLGNVTDDAQLKRSAGDFQAFPQKIAPAGGDSVLIEDGSDGNNKKRALIDSFLGGGINYDSPIAVNSDQTITPTDGDYFTSTAKLIDLTGTAGEIFEPADNAETSRSIWGRGAGLDLINVPINTSSLGVGDTFAIEADNGESRVLMLNSVGDLVKIGGVEIPMSFYAYADSIQLALASGAYSTCELDGTTENIGDTFDTSTFTQTIKRSASWLYSGFCGAKSTVAGQMERAVTRISVNGSLSTLFMDAFPVSANVGTSAFQVGSTGRKIALAIGDDIQHRTYAKVTTNTWSIQGNADPAVSTVNLSGLEIVPW